MTDQHSTVGQAPDRVPEKVTRALLHDDAW